MRTFKPLDYLGIVLYLFVPILFILALVGLPVGAWVGFHTFAELGVFAGTAASLGLIYWMVSSQIKMVKNTWAVSEKRVLESLDKVDYLNYGGGGAIGIDVEKKQICVVDALNQKKIKPPKVFSLDKLLSYQSHQPGRTEFYGSGLNSQVQADLRNSTERTKQVLATGLYMDLDDLAIPKLFLRMNYQEAEKWVFLLDKFNKGTLESRDKILFFPPIENR